MEKIFFVSLGCDKNSVDSEIMLGLIDRNGYTITTDEYEADVAIVNTCGFIKDAVQESIDNILELAELKRTHNLKTLIVTGCLAQRYKEEIFDEMPEVDAVVGVGDYAKIVDVIKSAANEKIFEVKGEAITEDSLQYRLLTTPGYYAYLKIAEGCNNKCTYCTIPSIRGEYRSRTMESLVQEAEGLSNKGVKELILVAQDTALYGTDIYGESKLPELICRLSKIEGIEWIRILYAYPEHISDELITTIAENPKCCHYLDIPIQHSNDKILKLMGRRSTEQQLRELIAKLRKQISDICLRTTLITGFPNEGEDEFNGLLNFIHDIRFDRLGVFAYSEEEGTAAARMKNQIPEHEKEQRRNILMEAQKKISEEKLKSRVGQTLKVIVDGKLPDENIYCGRSYMDCIDVDGIVFFNADYEIISGEMVEVNITSSTEYDLYGSL